MNKRFVGVLVFAFIVASVASLLLYRVLNTRSTTAKAAVTTVQIVVAAQNLEVGAVLKETDLRMGDWGGAQPPGSTQKPQELVGRGVTMPIYANEPVIESRLAQKGAGGGLAAMIPPGMRAVAVRVNEVVGVAGFVVPGMRVDVLIAGNRPGGDHGSGTLSRTLLQNLEVLSAGQDFKKDNEGKPVAVQVVNLLVTPEQAEQLSLASAQTMIQLVLRNPLDRDVAKTSGTSLDNLFTGAKSKIADPLPAPSTAAPRPRVARPTTPAPTVVMAAPRKEVPFTMEIISGTKKSEMKFDHRDQSGEGK